MRLLPNGEARFVRPGGRTLEEAPPLPTITGDTVGKLAARLARQEIAVDANASMPSWDGGTCDYGWALDYLRLLGKSVPGRPDDGRLQSAPAATMLDHRGG